MVSYTFDQVRERAEIELVRRQKVCVCVCVCVCACVRGCVRACVCVNVSYTVVYLYNVTAIRLVWFQGTCILVPTGSTLSYSCSFTVTDLTSVAAAMPSLRQLVVCACCVTSSH